MIFLSNVLRHQKVKFFKSLYKNLMFLILTWSNLLLFEEISNLLGICASNDKIDEVAPVESALRDVHLMYGYQ